MTTTKCRLKRIRLDSQGYDSDGHYYGVGRPLFEFQLNEDAPIEEIRAIDREDAKEKILRKFPGTKFYR